MNQNKSEDNSKVIFTGEDENTEIITLDNILDDLDVEENLDSFRSQILGFGFADSVEDETSQCIDLLAPLYVEYRKAMDFPNADQDVIKTIQARMLTITREVLLMLNQVFDLDVDQENLIGDDTLISTTLNLYRFFIIHFADQVKSVIENYIAKNGKSLEENFGELSQKKDIVSYMLKRHTNQLTAILASNIYDVTDFILCSLDTDTFVEFLSKDNAEASIIMALIKNDTICGEFPAKIADIMKVNVSLRASTCYMIMLDLLDKNPLTEAVPANEE